MIIDKNSIRKSQFRIRRNDNRLELYKEKLILNKENDNRQELNKEKSILNKEKLKTDKNWIRKSRILNKENW